MNTIASTSSCRLCALVRAAGRALRTALLPRTFAFIAALAVLVLMAPTGVPPFFPWAKGQAGAPAAAASAPLGAASGAASTVTTGAPPRATSDPVAVVTAASAPAKRADPAPAPATDGPSEAGSGGPASAPATTPPRWRFRTAKLPDPVVGQLWEPQPMLEPGSAPFRMSFEQRPPELQWMALDPEKGTIFGKPTQAGGPWAFELKVEPLGKQDQFLSQKYTLKVVAAPASAAARQAAAALRPQAAQPSHKPDLPGGPFTYRIDAAQLPELSAEPSPATLEALIRDAKEARAFATDPAEIDRHAAVEALARRDLEASRADQPPKAIGGKGGEPPKLDKLLAPLKDIDYPTEDLFRNALGLALCSRYGAPQASVSRAKNVGVGHASAELVACPTLSPEGRKKIDAIVERARKGHAPDPDWTFPWLAVPGCGCVPPSGDDEVHGFVSHWGTTQQQLEAAPAASAPPLLVGGRRVPKEVPRYVDFSLFQRLSFFGAEIEDDGEVVLPPAVKAQGRLLVDRAQRHGTRVDLVVHRRNWDSFFNGQDPARLAAKAADGTMQLLDEPSDGGGRRFLLPFWREETYAYGGVTVFFDNTPDGDGKVPPMFRTYRDKFIEGLIARMQANRRSYRLNVVVPADHMAETGPFTLADMTDLIEKAEPVRTSKKVDAKDKLRSHQGITDITVTYLVLLPEPTGSSKKALRERIDRSENPKGARRVLLLESLVPVLLSPSADKPPPWGTQAPQNQFRDDVAYMKWNYLGSALWELPGPGVADAARAETLRTIYRADTRRLPALCDVVCPQRLWLRLLLQALVGVGVVAFSLWFFSCAVRGWGLRYEAFLWLGGAVTVPLALAMLECDPALHELSESNVPLFGLVAMLFAGGLYWSFRLRRARP